MTNPRGIATSEMFNVTIYNKLNEALYIHYSEYGPNVTMIYAAIP
jgi:hypothetical protein